MKKFTAALIAETLKEFNSQTKRDELSVNESNEAIVKLPVNEVTPLPAQSIPPSTKLLESDKNNTSSTYTNMGEIREPSENDSSSSSYSNTEDCYNDVTYDGNSSRRSSNTSSGRLSGYSSFSNDSSLGLNDMQVDDNQTDTEDEDDGLTEQIEDDHSQTGTKKRQTKRSKPENSDDSEADDSEDEDNNRKKRAKNS